MHYKKKISIIFLAILILNITLLETKAQEEQKTIFERWIVPKTNISILGENFYVSDVTNHPNRLLLIKGDEKIILTVDEKKTTPEYGFFVEKKRFNLDKTHLLSPHNVPWYGKIDPDTERKLHAYYLEVKLIKPLLEISHSINNKYHNTKIENEFEFGIFQPLNITTKIINHGTQETKILFEEYIPQHFKIKNIITNADSYEIVESKEGKKTIKLQGIIDKVINLSYVIMPNQQTQFEYESKASYTYNNIKYHVVERNKTIIKIKPELKIKSGFYNGKEYIAKYITPTLGAKTKYGIVLQNLQDKNKDVTINITFSKNHIIHIKSNNYSHRLLNNKFNEILNIKAKNSTILEFIINTTKSKTQEILLKASFNAKNGKKQIKEYKAITDVQYKPIIPKLIINSTRYERTAEYIIYLVNPNINPNIKNLDIKLITKFGDGKDEYHYSYDQISFTSSFMINRLTSIISNNTQNCLTIRGTYETEFDESFSFDKTLCAEDNLDENYYKTAARISEENFLDLRYEEQMSLYDRKKPLTWYEKAGQITKTIMPVEKFTEKNNYFVPILVFLIIISIQTLQILRKKKQK